MVREPTLPHSVPRPGCRDKCSFNMALTRGYAVPPRSPDSASPSPDPFFTTARITVQVESEKSAFLLNYVVPSGSVQIGFLRFRLFRVNVKLKLKIGKQLPFRVSVFGRFGILGRSSFSLTSKRIILE